MIRDYLEAQEALKKSQYIVTAYDVWGSEHTSKGHYQVILCDNLEEATKVSIGMRKCSTLDKVKLQSEVSKFREKKGVVYSYKRARECWFWLRMGEGGK